MKKFLILAAGLILYFGAMKAQQSCNVPGCNLPGCVEQTQKNLPEVQPLFAPDTVPTPQYMTMVLLHSGAINENQVLKAHAINTAYDQRVKALTQNKDVTESELQKAADEQDNAYKAILSDYQERAYQNARQHFQRQNWGYNWMMNNCWSPRGWTCSPEDSQWPEWMPMYENGGPGWMMR